MIFQGFTEIQNDRHRSTLISLGSQKIKNLKSVIIQILQSHSPRYGDVQVIVLRFYCNSKWPPWMSFIFFCGRKKSKIEIRKKSHFTITLPTI